MARRGDGIYQRGMTWWLDFTHRGERHVARLGKNISRTVAGELARVERAAVLKLEAGIGGPKRKDPLFDDAVKEFVAWARTNRKARTAADYEDLLERLKAGPFGGRRLGQIDELSIERHKRARVADGAPVAANRELAVLKSLFNRCRDDLRIYEGPTPRIKLLKESSGRLRFLEPDEETRLLEAAAEPLRTIILVGIHTGLRIKSEALALQKTDVDLARGFLTVPAAYAKNGRTRTVPLNSTVRAALARLEKAPGALVFAKRNGTPLRSIRKPFRTACEAAGLEGVSPHTLRHTFASKPAMSGVDPATIQELGGWRSLVMVQRYTHLTPAHKAAAVERIASPEFPNAIPTPALRENGRRTASKLKLTPRAVSSDGRAPDF
jgi:integrase